MNISKIIRCAFVFSLTLCLAGCSAEYYLNRAKKKEAVASLDEAIAAYQTSIRKCGDSRNIEARVNLINLYIFKTRNYSLAHSGFDALNKVTGINPDWSVKIEELKNKLKVIDENFAAAPLCLPKNPDEAIAKYSAILAIDPDNYVAKKAIEEAKLLQVIPVQSGEQRVCEICGDVYDKRRLKTVKVQRKSAGDYKITSVNGICSKCHRLGRSLAVLLSKYFDAITALSYAIKEATYQDPNGTFGVGQRARMDGQSYIEDLRQQALAIDKNQYFSQVHYCFRDASLFLQERYPDLKRSPMVVAQCEKARQEVLRVVDK